jgi:xanthine/CO dehydrogenase XdhC/CoxF family maturation factor
MKELQAIVNVFQQLQTPVQTPDQTLVQIPEQSAALATVVHGQGSTYRRPGARMLVTATGQRVGTISGGCLENEVFQQAQAVIADHQPRVVTYDAIANPDLLWGLGLGCNGKVEVLIEPLDGSCPYNPLTFIAHCLSQRQLGVLFTVFRTQGSVPTQMGERLLLQENGLRQGNNQVDHNLQPSFVPWALADAHQVLQNRRSQTKTYEWSTGQAQVLIELIVPPPPWLSLGQAKMPYR